MPPHVNQHALAWLEGTLEDAHRERIEEHLADCEDCRQEFERMRLAWEALANWSPPRLPRALEERILRAQNLRTRGMRRPALLRIAAMALLAITCTGVGWWAGARSARAPSSPAGTQFLLLLEEAQWPPPAPLARAGYGEWARQLSERNQYVGAEKLTEESGFRVSQDGRMQPAARATGAALSGWYIVRAASYEEAAALVREGPHLRHGSVLIRQIE